MSQPRGRQLIALVAPTGSGKSAILTKIKESVDFEVISADSVQSVREFDIGSAKPSPQEQKQLRHHLIDTVNPTERYDAAQFASDAAALVSASPQTRFVLTAGTGLYLQALSQGLTKIPRATPERRQELEAEIRSDLGAAHAKLSTIDPASGVAIHPNDWYRILRRLEIYEQTNQPPSRVLQEYASSDYGIKLRYFGIWGEGHDYETSLQARISTMLNSAWIDEVEALVAKYSATAPALEAVGYRQITDYLSGQLDRAELHDKIYRATRRYAKRQRTWFRKLPVAWHQFSSRPSQNNLLIKTLTEELTHRFV